MCILVPLETLIYSSVPDLCTLRMVHFTVFYVLYFMCCIVFYVLGPVSQVDSMWSIKTK